MGLNQEPPDQNMKLGKRRRKSCEKLDRTPALRAQLLGVVGYEEKTDQSRLQDLRIFC